jgi:ectoine hydroxylase-related dioxygenase (phytanoyl-CoA dioxygenase family)
VGCKLPRPHIPLVFNSIIALDTFTVANGATQLIVGSHLWGEEETAAMAAGGLDSGGKVLRMPSGLEAQAISAVMSPGSLIGFDGAIWHAGGASGAGVGMTRLALSFVYCVGWLQQQENQYLAVPHADVVRMSATLQSLLGYDGSVDFVQGSEILKAEVAAGRGLRLGETINAEALAHADLMASLLARNATPRL